MPAEQRPEPAPTAGARPDPPTAEPAAGAPSAAPPRWHVGALTVEDLRHNLDAPFGTSLLLALAAGEKLPLAQELPRAARRDVRARLLAARDRFLAEAPEAAAWATRHVQHAEADRHAREAAGAAGRAAAEVKRIVDRAGDVDQLLAAEDFHNQQLGEADTRRRRADALARLLAVERTAAAVALAAALSAEHRLAAAELVAERARVSAELVAIAVPLALRLLVVMTEAAALKDVDLSRQSEFAALPEAPPSAG